MLCTTGWWGGRFLFVPLLIPCHFGSSNSLFARNLPPTRLIRALADPMRVTSACASGGPSSSSSLASSRRTRLPCITAGLTTFTNQLILLCQTYEVIRAMGYTQRVPATTEEGSPSILMVALPWSASLVPRWMMLQWWRRSWSRQSQWTAGGCQMASAHHYA